jgi:Polyketide cyclase / dehydrase and lipid transport
MSLSHSNLTDSQSRPGRHHAGWRKRHQTLAAGLVLTFGNLFAGSALATGARGPGGANPWGDAVTPDGARRVFTYSAVVSATPEEIFPLLCPVLEYEWIDDWSCQMEYSASGVAEQGCAFRTRIQVGESWICSRYEPPAAIQYVVWLRVGWMVLDVTLEDHGDGTTTLHWVRTFTATKPLGRKMVGKMTDKGIRGEMEDLSRQLVDYLESDERVTPRP